MRKNVLPAPLLAFAGLLAIFGVSLAYACISQISAFIFTHISVCGSLSKFPFFMRTLVLLD